MVCRQWRRGVCLGRPVVPSRRLNDYDGVGGLADIVWLALHEAGYDVSGIITSHTSLKYGASQEEIDAEIFERDGRLRAKGYTVEVVE